MKAIFNILYEKTIWQRNEELRKDIIDSMDQKIKDNLPSASTMIGLPGKGIHYLAKTDVGKGALAVGAGLFAARMLAKKYQKKNTKEETSDSTVSKSTEKPQGKELSWEKGDHKLDETIIHTEQNENLPRFPMLSYTQKIRKNPRSVSGFFIKRKPNNYDVNAGENNIEMQRKIAARNIKKTKADTGVDTVIGKLVA